MGRVFCSASRKKPTRLTALSIHQKALRGRNQNTPWKSATQSSTCGNRSQTGRSSSTCHRRCRCPCPISLPPKWPIFPRTFPTVMPLSFPSIPTMTAALVLPMQKWPCSPGADRVEGTLFGNGRTDRQRGHRHHRHEPLCLGIDPSA